MPTTLTKPSHRTSSVGLKPAIRMAQGEQESLPEPVIQSSSINCSERWRVCRSEWSCRTANDGFDHLHR